jgi:phosphomannomutase
MDTQVDPSIFRAYDIRGVVGQTLDPQVARLVGQAGSLMPSAACARSSSAATGACPARS